jgi:hypothetical protein
MLIEDGSGNGYNAAVSSAKRLLTASETKDASATASVDGRAIGFSTGDLTLTSSSPSAVLYIKNNEIQDLILFSVNYQVLESSGGGSNPIAITLVRNPLTGSVVANDIPVPVVNNLNFGSTFAVDAKILLGGEGETLLGGQDTSRVIGATPLRVPFSEPGVITIPRGATAGFVVTPPSGNTSIVVNIAITAYLDKV